MAVMYWKVVCMVLDLIVARGGVARAGFRMGAAAVLTGGAFFLTAPLLNTDPDVALWVALASAAVLAVAWGAAVGLIGALIGLATTRYVVPVSLGWLDIADPAVAARVVAAAVVATVVLAGIRRERHALRRARSAWDEARAARAATRAAAAASVRLETLFAAAPAGLAYVDADRRFARVNAAFVELLGIPGERLISRQVSELPASLREALDPWLGRALAGERISGIELHLVGPADRAPRYAMASVFPVPTTGARVEAGIVVQDVTALRSAERRLRRAQRLEAIGRIAGGIAHEVNHQLTVVLTGSELLRHRGIRPGGSELDEMGRAAQRAAQVIGQLLAYTHQQVLQLRPMRLDVHLGEASSELVEALGPQISLMVRPARAVQWVLADAEQLAQVLVHLASNARDAMPNGGRLLIETETVEVPTDELPEYPGVRMRPGLYARITVSDCGVGMPPQVRGRAFEPFFTTKSMGEGNGLGLSFVYGVVKQLDGYVWIDSTPGAGTTVRIDLPLVRDPAARPEALASGAGGSLPREHRGLVALGRDGGGAGGIHA